MRSHNKSMANIIKTAAITIPSVGNAVNVWELIEPHVEGKYGFDAVLGFAILATDPSGVSRSAIVYGGEEAQLGWHAAGVELSRPVSCPCSMYVSSDVGASIPAVIEVWILG